MDSLDSRVEKLLYYIFLGAQIHSTLASISTSYSHFMETMTRKLTKQLGLKSTLWDEIVSFISSDSGDDKPTIETIEVFGKEQNNLFQAFLLDNLSIKKTVRGKTAYQAKDCMKLSNGELYLDALERPTYIDEDVRHSTRSFHNAPDWIKYHGVKPTREGLDASRITFATFNGTPMVFQRNNLEENEPMSVTFISGSQNPLDKEVIAHFKRKFDEEVKYHSYYEGWLCQAIDSSGKIELNYLDETSITQANLDLFSNDVKIFLQTELPQYFKMQKHLSRHVHDSRRGYLIDGPSGSGKTTLLKSIISLVPKEYTILIVSNDNLNVLSSLKKYPFFFPLLVIIEDLNLVLPAADSAHTQMLTNFLDGIDSPDNVITIMTSTNMKEISSLITERHGRVDRVIKLNYGDVTLREKQLETITKGLSLPEGYSCAKLATELTECSMATLKELIKRSAVISQFDDNAISEQNLEKTIDELGIRKVSPVIPENQKHDGLPEMPQERQIESH